MLNIAGFILPWISISAGSDEAEGKYHVTSKHILRSRRGSGPVVVGLGTTYTISIYHH